jgi:hypothetical protein
MRYVDGCGAPWPEIGTWRTGRGVLDAHVDAGVRQFGEK